MTYHYNIVSSADEDEDSEPDPSEYCPFCHLKLSYLVDENRPFCSKCGYNIPEKLLINPPSSQNNKTAAAAVVVDDNEKPMITGGGGDSPNEEEDIAIVSWGGSSLAQNK